jgi:predicted SAM-dependent methyltransferase
MTKTEVLNIGGGSKSIALPRPLDEFEHVLLDIEDGPDVDIVLDVRYLDLNSEYEDRFGAVYISHNLEHFYAHEVPHVLRQAAFALAPGGTLYLRVPNLSFVGRRLAVGADLDEVAYDSEAGPITLHDMVYGYGRAIEDLKQDHWAHKTGFTVGTLRAALEKAGFTDLLVVESYDGWEVHARATWEGRDE